jgi:hypothetical protein
MITEDSACRNVEAVPTATLVSEQVASSASGTSNSSPRVRMTARSMTFANSLIFPFHGQFVSISIARLGMERRQGQILEMFRVVLYCYHLLLTDDLY